MRYLRFCLDFVFFLNAQIALYPFVTSVLKKRKEKKINSPLQLVGFSDEHSESSNTQK